MSELKLWLLGPPRLEQDGRPIDISRRKAMALLVYLVIISAGCCSGWTSGRITTRWRKQPVGTGNWQH